MRAFVFLLLCISHAIYAWDVTGHRLIAEIAYTQLNAPTKLRVNKLTTYLSHYRSPRKRFIQLSILADVKFRQTSKGLNAWHFIDQGFSVDGEAVLPTATPNVLTAIKDAQAMLLNSKVSQRDKAFALAMLLHFVGDAHQPLHCATRYTHQYPHGDMSGNRFAVKDRFAKNLHQFWDRGAGVFHFKGQRYPLRDNNMVKLAHKITWQYPRQYFGGKVCDLNANHWVMQSFALAKGVAYKNAHYYLSKAYRQAARRVVKKQVALAGYRLACLLNKDMS